MVPRAVGATSPAAYLTPDVVADITTARVTRVGADAVRLEGVQGHARPATLKVNVCFESGWFAEGEISYAGPRAEARARLAGVPHPKRGARTVVSNAPRWEIQDDPIRRER